MNDKRHSVAIDSHRPKPLAALIVSAVMVLILLGSWAELARRSTAAVVLGCTAALLAGCFDLKRRRVADLVRAHQVAAREQALWDCLRRSARKASKAPKARSTRMRIAAQPGALASSRLIWRRFDPSSSPSAITSC
jgi:hypothetical protein